ncbi:hypothetical protein BDN71DRAFT_204367 [Pleurotus eryngii]|uniref:Uncharacterized protein n=1 Tax=Pleurotus eryngii TaxID=5323 RepID=A0A9P6D3Z0_PLEER|nr:hypothetical protein BDN71DRAFT_204367 [Pleurotus eryngii]
MAVISGSRGYSGFGARWAARMCSIFVEWANVHNRRSRRGSKEIDSSLRVMRQGSGTELNLPQSDYECVASRKGAEKRRTEENEKEQ